MLSLGTVKAETMLATIRMKIKISQAIQIIYRKLQIENKRMGMHYLIHSFDAASYENICIRKTED